MLCTDWHPLFRHMPHHCSGSVRFGRPPPTSEQPRLQRNKAAFLLRKRVSSANLLAGAASLMQQDKQPTPSGKGVKFTL